MVILILQGSTLQQYPSLAVPEEQQPWSTMGTVGPVETVPVQQAETDILDSTLIIPEGSTLAMVEPRLLGGFRNQQMRLGGLVVYALQHNHTSLLLDSIRYDNPTARNDHSSSSHWSVQQLGRVPMESIIDVQYWNIISQRVGTNRLPRLVRYSPYHHEDWNPQYSLFGPLNASLVLDTTNTSAMNSRMIDLLPLVEQCTRPYAFGSGIKAGRLWNTWRDATTSKRGLMSGLTDLERILAQAIQPSRSISNMIQVALTGVERGGSSDNPINGNILVVHPRTETDMLGHRCSKHMTRNLTRIFEMIQAYPYFGGNGESHPNSVSSWSSSSSPSNSNNNNKTYYAQVYLCLSRTNMDPTRRNFGRIQPLVEENYKRLLEAFQHGLWNGTVPVREGGEPLAGSLNMVLPHEVHTAAQVLDFFVAVKAHSFVGTFGSSFSNDVWSTRYLLGKGDSNYQHSPNGGLSKVPNGGLPPRHHC